jgi:flagellar biosynthesis regulator FlbT
LPDGESLLLHDLLQTLSVVGVCSVYLFYVQSSMTTTNYKTSFTTGGLFLREASKAVELFNPIKDWDQVRERIRAENLLHSRTQTAALRTSRELIHRLEVLTNPEIEILLDGSRQEHLQILWLAVCKQYTLVYEFAVEVIHEKYLRLDLDLPQRDYDIFFNQKAEWHNELDQLTEMTKKKLRQVLFRMLREAEILSPTNQIQPMLLSSRVVDAIAADDPCYFAIYPTSDIDIRKQVRP